MGQSFSEWNMRLLLKNKSVMACIFLLGAGRLAAAPALGAASYAEMSVAGDSLLWLLAAAIFAVAVLYSSVGHAGASGYIAIMSLVHLAPAFIKPAALTLNIGVAGVAAWKFYRAGHFSWRLFWPFAVLAIPCAWFGGWFSLPASAFEMLTGAILLFSAWRFITNPPPDEPQGLPPIPVALGIGAVLGFLAGLTGTGGGIFLTPLLLFARWSKAKTAAAVSALFILFNSCAGLLGGAGAAQQVFSSVWPLLGAALAGGFIGASLGSTRLPHSAIKKCLAALLLVAGLKLVLA